MNCEKYLVLIDDLIEKRLDEPISQDIFSHFLDCQNCETEFETRFNVKDICATFIKNIEPLTNLPEQFQANLKVLRVKETTLARLSFGERLKSRLSFLSPKFGLAGFMLLIIFGLIHLSLVNSTNPSPAREVQSVTTNAIMITRFDPAIDQNKSSGIQEISKSTNEPLRISILKMPAKQRRPLQIGANSTGQKDGTQELIEVSKRDSESEIRRMKIKSFMAETRKQMEKTEMFFRSFRNARIIEGSDKFDIAYECQQAKELLERNISLRKTAESYGNDDVKKTLYVTEIVLNEIVNLEGDFSQVEVIVIKRQISSRNIIAILQTYQIRSANI